MFFSIDIIQRFDPSSLPDEGALGKGIYNYAFYFVTFSTFHSCSVLTMIFRLSSHSEGAYNSSQQSC